MTWYSLERIDSADQKFSAKITVPLDSLWFSGHFPDNPVLPGIALVAMAVDVVSQSFLRDTVITGLKKIRFKRVVRPNDPLILTVRKHEKKRSYTFEVTCHRKVACTGTLLIESP